MPKLCPNIRFPHQQDFFPIRSVTKSSTSRFSHENLVEKFKIFVQDLRDNFIIKPSNQQLGTVVVKNETVSFIRKCSNTPCRGF